ncbi:uncharacterized protein LOC131689426 isoform X2 [Topomyia yanbarensis]|uniref:uncharacterized protein LOC131689426 isoform X2 n=1 Tax=Topomyia yanbarensis TaxID=2498891 RepID=UPI00273C1F89|nr:uncharacterized protein LOC131689426 isoform X2 [Topomyia yanbarensis]
METKCDMESGGSDTASTSSVTFQIHNLETVVEESEESADNSILSGLNAALLDPETPSATSDNSHLLQYQRKSPHEGIIVPIRRASENSRDGSDGASPQLSFITV